MRNSIFFEARSLVSPEARTSMARTPKGKSINTVAQEALLQRVAA